MRTTDLLKSCDEFYGRILRHVDVTLEDPEHRRVAKRIICSKITGACDTIASVMDGVILDLNYPTLVDHLELHDHNELWMLTEGLQYADNGQTVAHIRPVFDACGLAELFDCVVHCFRMLDTATDNIQYMAASGEYTGGTRLVASKTVIMKNHIRAYAGLPPVTNIVSDRMDTFICTPVVTLHLLRKWKTNMLWRRLREYVRCLHHTVPDRVTETRDVMGHVVSALGL